VFYFKLFVCFFVVHSIQRADYGYSGRENFTFRVGG